jgi:hypothetical protein
MDTTYLLSKAYTNGWTGRDILKIPDFSLKTIENSENWFLRLPPMQAIANSPLSFINELILELVDVIPACSLLFLETNYGIAKVFNSEENKGNLTVKGTTLLSKPVNRPADEIIYESAYNTRDSLDELTSEVEKLSNGLIHDPLAHIRSYESEAIYNLKKEINSLIKQVKKNKGIARQQFRQELIGAKNAIKRIRDLKKQKAIARFLPVPVPIVPPPATIGVAAKIITEIAGWFLNSFLLKGIALLVPVEALTWTISSIVIKFMGGVGANACRYIAGGIIGTSTSFLPSVISSSGFFAGTWALLGAFAPIIIIGAVLTIAIMKRKVKIGEYLYVVGKQGQATAFGCAKLYDTNRVEMEAVLRDLGRKVADDAFTSFDNLMGFALNEQREPVMALNLSKDKHIIGKAMNTAINPFLSMINVSI